MQEQSTATITESDKEALLAGLRSGLGLTQSASIIGLTPKEITAIILHNSDLFNEAKKAVKYQAKVFLVLSNQYLKDKKFNKWKETNEAMKLFVSSLNLWESHCNKKNIDNIKAAEAFVITNDIREAATVCGMTLEEYNRYLLFNPAVKSLIQKMLAM